MDKHIFLLLTKRPERMAQYFCGWYSKTILPIENLWLGTTVEKPEYYYRIEILKQIPAAKTFLSLEPLLSDMSDLPLNEIDWVIVGAESKGQYVGRECKPCWIQSITEQCIVVNVPVFVKQAHLNGKIIKPNSPDWPKLWPQEIPEVK